MVYARIGLVACLVIFAASAKAATFSSEMKQGYANFSAGNFANATASFGSALKLAPKNNVASFWYYHSLACQQAQARQYAKAIGNWNNAKAIYSTSAPTINVYINNAQNNNFNINLTIGGAGGLWGLLESLKDWIL